MSSSHPPLVLINGLGAPKLAAHGYGLYFRLHGHKVWTVPQPLLLYEDIRVSARRVAKRVDQILARTGSPKVNILGMSLGGLIGWYYLKCCGGAPHTDRFISIGGPLNGVPLLSTLSKAVPLGFISSLPQTGANSDLFQDLHKAPSPEGVQLFSVGSNGDPLVPRSVWDHPEFTCVESTHGVFPVGHWLLFTHPSNQRLVLDLLTRHPPKTSTAP